jgi:hypothetical protein
MGAQWPAILTLMAVFLLLLGVVYRSPRVWRAGRLLRARAEQVRRLRCTVPADVQVRPVRPFELVVGDARRVAARLQDCRGLSFAKQEALRCVYDRVLGEMCDALGVDHLLGVLPTGDELDAERARTENVLWLAGVRLGDAA